MLQTIIDNLTRQSKGLALLLQLMQEEFSLLKANEPRDVTRVEFSIQELMGQLMAERKQLKGILYGTRLVQFLDSPSLKHPSNKERADAIRSLMQTIHEHEQQCAKQAEKNSKLVLALMDQGEKLLHHMYDQLRPKKKDSYSNRGTYASNRPQAALIKGRL